ncbi:MAG: Hsp70 family protein [Defluviitaleaceae bacterium]|nr:Hsp70 family protein [Defluviitaleaceae bacterium]
MNWQSYRKEISEKKHLPSNLYILGIDLGTTNSIISYYDAEAKEPVPIDVSMGFGQVPLPSVVQYRPKEDEWVIGSEAYRTIKMYPHSTARSVKNLMGSDSTIQMGQLTHTPEEISAKILTELVSHVTNIDPNAEIAGIVLSVPYDFGQSAKKATLKAMQLAGLEQKLITLIEEPKAAALAYNFSFDLALNEIILVFDFGGGTLDITMFQVIEKTKETILMKVISEGGAVNHGGDNIDQMLLGYLHKQFHTKTGQTPEDIPIENQLEIVQQARETKERLSRVTGHRIPFSFAMPPFMVEIKRPFFEELIAPFVEKTKMLTHKSLQEAHPHALSPAQVSRVLLEGGSSGMPWVKNMLSDIFGEEKIYISKTPALDISRGATYYAAMKMGLINTPDMEIPIEIQATIPHDIGIEVQLEKGPAFFCIIPKGTSYVLAKKSHTFTLSGETEEEMTGLTIKLMERSNKDDDFEKCRAIGEFKISGLPKRPKGKTKVKLTLTADENMVIKGMVEDMGFGKEFERSGFKERFS